MTDNKEAAMYRVEFTETRQRYTYVYARSSKEAMHAFRERQGYMSVGDSFTETGGTDISDIAIYRVSLEEEMENID